MQRQHSYWDEKIPYFQPDLGDQRKSTFKALPSPPATPKRVMKKFRLSAIGVATLVIVAFVLTLLVAIAGKKPNYLEEEYMLKLNTSHIGEDIIRFDTPTSTSSATASSTATSSSNPLDPLNPFSTASPLNPNNPDNPLGQLTNSLEPILGNLTDSINDGIGDAVNQVIEAFVDAAGVKDFYYLYLNHVCEGDLANGTKGNADGVNVKKCASYGDSSAGLNAIVPRIQSSIVIGATNVSVPLIAQLTHSIGTLSSGVSTIRRTLFALIIISLIGSGITTVSTMVAVFFPGSRLLIYVNFFFSSLGQLAAFLTAILLTALIGGVNAVADDLGKAVGLVIGEGRRALAFVWVSWALLLVASVYWGLVWFVEVRRWAFVRRERGEDEVGNWRGIRREVWRDLKGEKDA